MVLSIFFNLDPSEFATPAARATEVNSVVTAAAHKVDEAEGLEPDARTALRADVERVREVLEGSDVASNGTHGLAVYACGPADLLEIVRLPHPIESAPWSTRTRAWSRWIRSGSDERWCVLLVNRKTARIFTGEPSGLRGGRPDRGRHARPARPGRLVAGALPALGRAGEAQPPRRGARHALHPLQAAAVRPPPRRRPDELVAEVEQRLHPYLRDKLAGRLHVDVENSSPDEVRPPPRRVVDHHVAEVEREALDRLSRASAAATAAPPGPPR